MTLHDLYLISPEISMAALATLLLLVDFVVSRKSYVVVIGVLGLAVPLGLCIHMWGGLENGVVHNDGVLVDSLVVDAFSIFFKCLVISAVAGVILMSTDYARRFNRFQSEYYALLLFSATGMMLLVSAVELITMYVSLELTALPLAALSAFNRDSRSSESGMKFLVLSGLSSAILLYGMVLVYGLTGSTELAEIADQLANKNIGSEGQMFGNYALLMGIVMLIAGFGFKITAVPFQMWAPDVYEGSPTPIAAFFSVASKAAGFAVILRVFYVAFPMDVLSFEWSAIFAGLAAVTMTIGNFVAISQTNIKRLLAYSTIAHAGYIMLGIAAIATRSSGDAVSIGPEGVLYYLAGYAIMNMAAFSTVVAMTQTTRSDEIKSLVGMGMRSPFLAAALAVAFVSLIGVPPTVGFMVKIYIFGAALNAGLTWLVVIGVLNSVVSAYYYLKVIKIMYFHNPTNKKPVVVGIPARILSLVATGGVVIFGFYPEPLLNVAKTAAAVLPGIG